MSTRMGFPDLTAARRRSLCDLLKEIKSRPEQVKAFAKLAKANTNGLKVRMDQYTRLEDAVLVQFPECYDQITDQELRREGMSNAQLRSTLRMIDQECCMVMDLNVKDLQYYLATGDLSPVLKVKAKGRKK